MSVGRYLTHLNPEPKEPKQPKNGKKTPSPTLGPTSLPTRMPITSQPTTEPPTVNIPIVSCLGYISCNVMRDKISLAIFILNCIFKSSFDYITDVCYPGCSNFTSIYTNREFEELIMKHVPCNSSQCNVTIIEESDPSQCVSCNIATSSRRRRLLDQTSSEITFRIESNTPLNETIVTFNLNSNITNANNDLMDDNITFQISNNFTLKPTPSPSTSPTQSPSVVSAPFNPASCPESFNLSLVALLHHRAHQLHHQTAHLLHHQPAQACLPRTTPALLHRM
jgi:hypothetical protein